ncbi:hypothetical protein ZWY2020_015522 [Hordeum vulgare]|nr:hypothetical protein ZWY2020_015494 [Hordeum vulgare]KAI4978769.1 hypothetical protein ZWY2020_015522 [Hordeum vulgare]
MRTMLDLAVNDVIGASLSSLSVSPSSSARVADDAANGGSGECTTTSGATSGGYRRRPELLAHLVGDMLKPEGRAPSATPNPSADAGRRPVDGSGAARSNLS